MHSLGPAIPNGISITSAVFAGLMAVTNTEKHRPWNIETCVGTSRIYAMHALQRNNNDDDDTLSLSTANL